MRALLALPFALALPHCGADEPQAGHGTAGKTWLLTEIDGQAFTATASLTFPEPGKIAGEAPCNRFFATQTHPYPGFAATAIATTRRACPEMAQETAFLDALAAMTLAEVAGTTLILSTPEGREMVFRAAP